MPGLSKPSEDGALNDGTWTWWGAYVFAGASGVLRHPARIGRNIKDNDPENNRQKPAVAAR